MKSPRSKLKAVLFDVDGTLIDTEKIQSDAFRKVLQEHGHHKVDLTEHGTIHVPGETTHETWTRLKGLHDLSTDVIELTDRKRNAAIEALNKELDAMEGVIDLFDSLKKAGVKIAIVSSAQRERLDLIIDGLGIDTYIDAVVSANDVSSVKPSPEPYLAAAKILGVPSSTCVVIEDAVAGVQSANAAGMAVVAVPNSYTHQMDFKSANRKVNSLSEVTLAILEELVN